MKKVEATVDRPKEYKTGFDLVVDVLREAIDDNANATFNSAGCEVLLTEVERLRKIEDAVRWWSIAEPHEMEDACDNLSDVLDHNPRPE